jgi:hypothetical protein
MAAERAQQPTAIDPPATAATFDAGATRGSATPPDPVASHDRLLLDVLGRGQTPRCPRALGLTRTHDPLLATLGPSST